MTKTEIFSVQGQAAMWVWVLWTNMAKTEIFSVQGQAAMWVWILWTSPVPIWPKQRSFVCRDKLLCGFESFEPHQYQYDKNGDVLCAGTSCYVGLSPLNLTSTNMTKTEMFCVQGQSAMWVWILWTSPVPIWPKQRSLVCRDKLLCGFESFEPHQYQYDQNKDL